MLKILRNAKGYSLPTVVVLSAIAIGALIFAGNYVKRAQEAQRSQKQDLRDSAALQGILGYAMNALENRYCWETATAIKKGTCPLEDDGNLERLLLLDQTIYDIGQRFSSELSKPLNQLRKTKMDFAIQRDSISSVHPLAPYLNQVTGNLETLHFIFTTKVEREHGDMIKARVEVVLDVKEGGKVIKSALSSYADMILYPRQINMYSLVLAQNLDFNILKPNLVGSMAFKSPVFINKDLVITSGESITNWKFEDLVFTGGILMRGNSPFAPEKYGHIDHLLTSQIEGFNGIKGGHLLVETEPALVKMFDPNAKVDNSKILECIDYLKVKNSGSLMATSQLLAKRNPGNTNNQVNIGLGLSQRNEFTTERLGENTDSSLMQVRLSFLTASGSEYNCHSHSVSLYKGKVTDIKFPKCSYKSKKGFSFFFPSPTPLATPYTASTASVAETVTASLPLAPPEEENDDVEVQVSIRADFGSITNSLSGYGAGCLEAKSQLNIAAEIKVKNQDNLDRLFIPVLEMTPSTFSPVDRTQKIRLDVSYDRKSVILPSDIKSDNWFVLSYRGEVVTPYFNLSGTENFTSSKCASWAATQSDINQEFKNKECSQLYPDLAKNFSDKCYCEDVNLSQLNGQKDKMTMNTSFVETSYSGWNFKPLSKIAANNILTVNGVNQRDLHLYSILDECRIEDSATQVIGLLACRKLVILPRVSKLTFIGTFIVNELVISPGVSSSVIEWMNMYHPSALSFLRNGTVLLTNADCEIDPAKPIWHPLPTDKMTYRQRRCSPFSIIDRFDPFKWTTFDPVCGYFSSATPFTTCRPQDRIYNFYSVILEQKQVF